jgi:16S rRNA pseudouridine516 synthase
MLAPMERIDRFLARRVKLSWSEVHLAIHRGRVAIDGVVCSRYHRPLASGETVVFDGWVVHDGPDDAVLICHKAAGWACSHEAKDEPLIYDTVPEPLRHPDLQTAGRLDRDTTGLIVITIDGKLIQRITDPAQGLWKRYRIRYTGTLAEDAVARVAGGLTLPDDPQPCLPARLALDAPGAATLELCEGRHHQVKRMILALGGLVVGLHRDRVGALELPADLAPGAMRPARPDELAALP